MTLKPAAFVCPECWQTYHSSNCQARPPVKRIPLFTRDDLVRVAVEVVMTGVNHDIDEQCAEIVSRMLGEVEG